MKQRRPRPRWTNYTKPVIPLVDPERIARGDWLRSRTLEVWMKVDCLKRCAGRVYAEGSDVYGRPIRIPVDDATPCWNPKTMWYGHQSKPM